MADIVHTWEGYMYGTCMIKRSYRRSLPCGNARLALGVSTSSDGLVAFNVPRVRATRSFVRERYSDAARVVVTDYSAMTLSQQLAL
eukprot:6172722-Pleurochrysis_carterae.AAC.1